MIALDFDSFSPKGGQPFYDKAATVVQQAQSSGEIGWKTFEDTKNRSAVLSGFTDSNTGGIRDLYITITERVSTRWSQVPTKDALP